MNQPATDDEALPTATVDEGVGQYLFKGGGVKLVFKDPAGNKWALTCPIETSRHHAYVFAHNRRMARGQSRQVLRARIDHS